MKRLTVLILLTVSIVVYSDSTPVQIESIPSTIEEFLALRDVIATTPEGGAVMFILAMILYSEDDALGLAAFTITLDSSELREGDVYMGYKPGINWYYFFEQLDKFDFLGRIYIQQTGYEDGYMLPSPPFVFSFSSIITLSENEAKVYIETTSGNMPRPFMLYKNNRGIWKVKEASSLFVGPSLMPPVQKDDAL